MTILDAIRVPAKIEYLYECIHLVSFCAKQQGFEQRGINKIALSTEEALVNIFNHAYKDAGGDVEITCMIEPDEKFVIEIRDSGVPFNMLSVEEPAPHLDIDSDNTGGLGIFMIKKLMDEVQYRRESGANILTLIARKHK
jgi:serine/threonine-protein kinase RsbW